MSARSQISESASLTLMLSVAGGFLGAYTNLCRTHGFANAQTGNVVLVGINLARGNMAGVFWHLSPIIFFLIGIAFADFVRHYCHGKKSPLHWRQITLLLSAALCGGVSFLPQSHNLFATSLVSMVWGIEIESFLKVHSIGEERAMNIGNMRAAVHYFCDFLFTKDRRSLHDGLTMLYIIGMFTLGAAICGFTIDFWQERAVLFCAAIFLIGFAAMFYKGEGQTANK